MFRMPLKSYIQYSADSHFPIENLPYGVFSTKSDECKRIGVAIGDLILDLKHSKEVFSDSVLAAVFQKPVLNDLLELGQNDWRLARSCIQKYLSEDKKDNIPKAIFVKQSEAIMHLPVNIGDYTDYFSDLYHAKNCYQSLNVPFPENWKHLPSAYHGKSSTVCISETPVKRPAGQYLKDGDPIYGPSQKLDFELEMGLFIGGTLNKQGEPLKIDDIQQYMFGMVLLNDWSARDVQFWESAPLGPLLSKNFATSISPWIVTMDALMSFVKENPVQDPVPLPYLQHNDNYIFDINLEAHLKNGSCDTVMCKTNYSYIYWTPKQQLAHLACNGCQMKPGDLLGSGTLSGPTEDSLGCMFESTDNGKKPFKLSNGEIRNFLQDNDEVVLTGFCQGDGYRIGFGSCSGKILPCAL